MLAEIARKTESESRKMLHFPYHSYKLYGIISEQQEMEIA
jgi:hypothetical protein